MRVHGYTTSILLLLWTILRLSIVRSGCPNPHKIHPCSCLKSKSILECEDVTQEDTLSAVMQVSKKHKVVGVELNAVVFRYIPHDAFDGTNIQSLVITNSSIISLSDTDYAFKGLEESLRVLEIKNCSYVNSWDWTQLRNLLKLEELEISNSELLELTEEFLKISSQPLVELDFRENHIQWLPDNAFASFKKLERLKLGKNDISVVKRSMFPKPAKKLQTLGLSYNHIKELPEDIFSDMPSLKFLYLESNPIRVLDEKVFKPIWKQIKMLIMYQNLLICDCRLMWLTKMNHKLKFIHGSCSAPPRL
ncbi:Slit-like protein, partial [Stegodyphus mimosarum]